MPKSQHSDLEQPESFHPSQQLLASDQSGQQPEASIAGASRKKSTGRKHIDFLPRKQQRDKEQVIKDCIALKEANHGRLPRGEGTAAMKQLKIKSRQTLLNLIERYELHRRLHPEEPAVNALIELRGRPPSRALTLEQEKVGYVRYGNVDDTLQRLNRGIRSGEIITLAGFGGVGKSRMLEQLAVEEPKVFEKDQIAIVQMLRPNRRSFSKDRIATPPAMVFFSRLWYVMQKMSRLTHKEWLETLDRNPAHHYTDPQFLSLHANIAEAFEQRHIALVLADNIEDIDGVTLDWLVQLWNDCGQRFAIVLCAQMKPNATSDEPFTDLWSYVSNNAREYLVDELVLDRMDKITFVEVVLPALLDELNADYGSGVSLSEPVWQRTQGNWHGLTRLVTFFDEELAADKRSPRIITQAVVNRVFSRR